MKDDIRFPRSRRPHYSRVITGPVESVDPYRQIEVSGQLILPIPIGGIGEVAIKESRPRPWAASVDDWSTTYEVVGGYGQVVCRPEVFHYRMNTYGAMWQDERARESIEHQIRHSLLEAATDRFIINMEARLV